MNNLKTFEGFRINESVSRHCGIYKAKNGSWYLELASKEHGDQDDATTYGPFATEEKADDYIKNFSNPGGSWVDDSGTFEVPTKSPNGKPIVNPRNMRQWG